MEKVLITGGAGYIGSHITLNVLRKGYKVVVLDSFFNSSMTVFEDFCKVLDDKILKNNFEIIKGDIREKKIVQSIFEENLKKGEKIDAVIHCAGLKSVVASIKNPENYWDVNVLGTINLLSVMKNFRCRKIIFSGSATVYDPSRAKKLNENSFLKPINPYGNTKFVNEKFLQDIFYSSNREWKIVTLRYFNPIGANSDGIIGESPISEKSNIFPRIIDVASKKINKLTIYGRDWDTNDGTCIRDYIHIDDLAESHVRAMEYLSESQPTYLNLNIGTGKGTSILELIKVFEIANKVDVPFIFGDRREGDFGCVVADNSLAKKVLNWTPKKSLIDMCQDGWNWVIQSEMKNY